MAMKWSRIALFGSKECATRNCSHPARWSGEAGDVASVYCSECRDSIDALEIISAARDVVRYDWSDNDDEPVAAIERLRSALKNQ